MDTVLIQVQLLKQRLVEQPADMIRRLQVRPVAVAGEVEGVPEVGFERFEPDGDRSKTIFDGRQLTGDAVLLGLQQVERDGTGIVGLEQFGALVDEPLPLDREVTFGGFGLGAALSQLLAEHPLKLLPQLWRELYLDVVVLDEFLNLGDQHGLAGAAGALLVPPEAHEIGVDDAVAVLGVGHDQS